MYMYLYNLRYFYMLNCVDEKNRDYYYYYKPTLNVERRSFIFSYLFLLFSGAFFFFLPCLHSSSPSSWIISISIIFINFIPNLHQLHHPFLSFPSFSSFLSLLSRSALAAVICAIVATILVAATSWCPATTRGRRNCLQQPLLPLLFSTNDRFFFLPSQAARCQSWRGHAGKVPASLMSQSVVLHQLKLFP